MGSGARRFTRSRPTARASPSTLSKSASPTMPPFPAACRGPTRPCISCPPQRRHTRALAVSLLPKLKPKEKLSARDVSFSLGDLESVRVCSEVDRSTCTAHLAADRAHTELIWHRCAGLDRESHSSTMATSLELDWHGFSEQEKVCFEALKAQVGTGTVDDVTEIYSSHTGSSTSNSAPASASHQGTPYNPFPCAL